jgi:hypothetical protein
MIDGKEVKMRASALIPRLYRVKFGRDIIKDITRLKKNYKAVEALPADATEEEREAAQLSVLDLTIFEDIAWLMIRHAGEDIPDTPDEWLESLDGVFSIYDNMETVLELWGENQITTSEPKKK